MARSTLMDPPIEDLLDKVDSKFTLVALGAKRARQVNSYYNSLGEGLGRIVPPQVTSVSGKPLSIAFEEIAAGKVVYHRGPGDESGDGAEPGPAGEHEARSAADKAMAEAMEAALAGGAFGEEPAEVDEGPAAG